MNPNAIMELPRVDCSRGAPHGRRNQLPQDPALFAKRRPKLYLQRVVLIDNDYDKGGAYWGGRPSPPLYCAWTGAAATTEIGIYAQVFVRARNREDAKYAVTDLLPDAGGFYK